MRRAFVFDQSKCVSCNTCTIACKDWNQVNPGPVRWRTAKTYETDAEPVFFPFAMGCAHCANPACANECPENAIIKRPDGVLHIDRNKCIACDACVNLCPFKAPKRADDIQEPVSHTGWRVRHPAQKCAFCMDRIDGATQAPKTPACVLACPTFAVDTGDYDELVAKYKEQGKEIVQLNQADFPYMYKDRARTDTDPSFLVVKRKPMKFTENIG